MIDKTILAATTVSSNNPAALAAFALIALSLAEPPGDRSHPELCELINKWGQTLRSVDPAVVERLCAQLRATRPSLDAVDGPLKHAR